MGDNEVVIEAWNTVLFDKFVRFKHLLVAGLAGHSDEVLSRHPFAPGARVLDVGCGFGDSTLRIAAAVAPGGYSCRDSTSSLCPESPAISRCLKRTNLSNSTVFQASMTVSLLLIEIPVGCPPGGVADACHSTERLCRIVGSN